MRAGELTEVITVQRMVPTKDANGSVVDTWEDIMTVRASYASRSGSRSEDNMNTYATSSATFTTHYRPSIKGMDRLKYNGNIWYIQGEPVHRRMEDLTIITAELDVK